MGLSIFTAMEPRFSIVWRASRFPGSLTIPQSESSRCRNPPRHKQKRTLRLANDAGGHSPRGRTTLFALLWSRIRGASSAARLFRSHLDEASPCNDVLFRKDERKDGICSEDAPYIMAAKGHNRCLMPHRVLLVQILAKRQSPSHSRRTLCHRRT